MTAKQFTQTLGVSRLQQGISLIEMMVVVAIVCVLAMMSAQFGLVWSDNAKVTQSQATLQQAYAFTKAAALQNYSGRSSGEPSAVLCFSGLQLNVYQGGSCSGVPIWSRPLSSGAVVTFGTPGAKTAAVCVALSNAGIPQLSAGSLTCTTSLNYTVAAGAANVANKNLY